MPHSAFFAVYDVSPWQFLKNASTRFYCTTCISRRGCQVDKPGAKFQQLLSDNLLVFEYNRRCVDHARLPDLKIRAASVTLQAAAL